MFPSTCRYWISAFPTRQPAPASKPTAVTLAVAVLELALEDGAVGEGLLALAVELGVLELSLVDAAAAAEHPIRPR